MVRGRMRAAVVAVVLLSGGLGAGVASADSGATTLLVEPGQQSCSDTSSLRGSVAVPFCTIQAGVDAAQPGQTVAIEQGIYPGSVTVTHSGEPGKPITITSVGSWAEMVSPDGTALSVRGVHDVDVSHIAAGRGSVLVQDSQRIALDAIETGSSISGQLTSLPAAVSIQGATTADVSVTRSTILPPVGAPAGTSGIVVGPGAVRTVVSSDVVRSSYGDGVVVDGALDTGISGNTFLNNCFDAVDVTGAAAGTTVKNNIMDGDNVAQTGGMGGRCVKDAASVRPELSVAAPATATTTADANLLGPAQGTPGYLWAGVSYPGPAQFAATGQGSHDVQGDPQLNADTLTPLEGSPALDSGIPDAAGLSTTDFYGHQRVRDPMAPGALPGSSTDRGAVERQDPLQLGAVTVDQALGVYPLPVTAAVAVTNPWHTTGVSYTFDFGDGTKVVSNTPMASHTYTTAGSRRVNATATVPQAPAPVYATTEAAVAVNPPSPLIVDLLSNRETSASGLAITLETALNSAWPVTGYTFDFGDGSAPVTSTETTAAHTYPHPGTYTATVTVTNKGGQITRASTAVHAGDALVPLTPVRILDTRHGTGAPQHSIAAGGVLRLKVTGQGGLPASGVDAVTMNVTATDASADTYITAYPDGTPRPLASTLNLRAGQTVPNQVTVKVGADGYVDLANYNGTVDLIADIQGYYTTQTLPAGGGFVSVLGPYRLLDTRTGTGSAMPAGKVGPGKVLTFRLGTTPGQEKAVLMNLTETNATADGYVSAYPGGGARPVTSVLNFRAGQTVSNQVLVPVAADGTVSLYNSSGSVDLIADSYAMVGQYGAVFVPTDPIRAVDTRNGTGVPRAKIKAGGSVTTVVPGSLGIPGDASALLVNLTATNTTTPTWLSVHTPPAVLPKTSSLNLGAAETRANSAEISTDAGGANHATIISNSAGSADAILDIEGYYLN